MPRGVPVATVAINNATNAALLAVRILGAGDVELLSRFGFSTSSISYPRFFKTWVNKTQKKKEKERN